MDFSARFYKFFFSLFEILREILRLFDFVKTNALIELGAHDTDSISTE